MPLTNGLWYLGVVNRDGTPIHYSVLAKELDNYANPFSQPGNPVVINLTNEVPFSWTAGPGAALTNFFHFHATNSVVNGTNIYLQGPRSGVYGNYQAGQRRPDGANYYAAAGAAILQRPARNLQVNTPEVNGMSAQYGDDRSAGDWYLGVPNREITNINYTVVVGIETNLYFPAFPGAVGAGGGTIGAGHAGASWNPTVYHVTTLDDSGQGSLRDAVSASDRTVVFDIGGVIALASPLTITSSNLTLAGQTSPGGITVAGDMTSIASTHDVIVRDIRFRPAEAAGSGQNIVWENGFEGASVPSTPTNGDYFAGGWLVDRGSVDWINGSTGPAYEGNWYIDLDGSDAGEISTNISTVAGATYTLSFAYCQNPLAAAPPSAQILINGTQLGTVAPTIS